MNQYLALDIGGTNIKYGILNQQGDILLKDKFATEDNQQSLLDAITALAKKHQGQHQIKGIAVSAPGMIDADRGHLVTAGALRSMYDFPFKQQLEELTGLPVEVENDVNCVALAEKWLGKGADAKHFICLTIGTGIGGAIVINDALYRGHSHMAGEFGFMISKQIQGDDVASSILSSTGSTRGGIVNAYRRKTGIKLNGEEISELYQQQDPVAVEVINDFAHYMAVGIYNLIVSLDPQKVLIGGAVSANSVFIDLIREKVVHLVACQPYLSGITLPAIETCQFSNDSGLIGALYNFKIRQ